MKNILLGVLLLTGICFSTCKVEKDVEIVHEGFFANDPKAETPNLNSFTSTPDGAFTEYRLRTSDRWIFSAAAIIGQTALISVDYELTRYKAMHLSGWAGEVEYHFFSCRMIRNFPISPSVKKSISAVIVSISNCPI